MKEYQPGTVWAREVKGLANWYGIATGRLLDKGVIKLAGEFNSEKPAFMFTPLGFVVKQLATSTLQQFNEPTPQPEGDRK